MARTKKSDNILSQIKWGESYTSLFLGAVVVVIALILVFSFLRGKTTQNGDTQSTSTQTEESITGTRSYTVKEGDDLWNIAERLYGSGYNWVDIASASKLENPSILYVGTKLTIPNVQPKEATKTLAQETPKVTNTITGASYTIVSGDYLWDIAIRAYGDGYRWVDIASANKLENPDIIHPGNVLKLPR